MVDLLIPDTNTWLDVLRARATGQGGHPPPATSADDASHVGRLVAAGELQLGVPRLVTIEYERNESVVMESTRQHYREIANRLARLGVDALPPSALKAEQLLANDRIVAVQLMGQAEVIDDDGDDQRRAEDRYRHRRPPAHRGGSTTHDSRVLEAALRVARERDPGTTWLLTRNTTEFEQDGRLHPQLEGEYEAAGLRHAQSWRGYLAAKQLMEA